MDILKKMLGLNSATEKELAANEKNAKSKVPAFGNDFKKPIWYDEESDDELFDNNKMFGFQIFSNPIEIQKYHEQQMRNMLKAFEQFDETKGMFDESFREEYMKPGFENFELFGDVKKPSVDVDLDGEIYADQLHSLLQRISPEVEKKRSAILPLPKAAEPKRKLTDEEKVMDQIHCIDDDEEIGTVAKPKFGPNPPNVRIPHYGGAFEGIMNGPKTHRQTFSYQIIRKPEGTYTTKTFVDPNGNTKTIIKRTVDGKTNTQTLINGVNVNDKNAITGFTPGSGSPTDDGKPNDWIIDPGRYFYINKDGYALPKNLW